MQYAYVPIALLFFAIGAVSDVLKREVKDELTIALWLFMAYVVDFPQMQLAIISFCFIWAIAVLGEKLKIKIFGWGDVLWGAPFIGLATVWISPKMAFALFGLCFVAGQFYLHWQYKIKNLPKEKVRGVPFVAYLAVALFLAFIMGL